MDKADVAKMIGVTRQHIDFVLSGKRNFSFPVARNATAVIGGTLGLWQDKSRSEERKVVWKKFMDAVKVSSEEL